MFNMKKVFVCIVATILPLFVSAEKTHLIVTAKDGTQVAFALQEQPKVTFIESELQIQTSNLDVFYPLDNMANFKYEKRDIIPSSVVNLQEKGVPYLLEQDYILFPALVKDTEVSLYTITGVMIFSKKANQSGEYLFSLSHLNSAIYVLKVNDLTYKIIKR